MSFWFSSKKKHVPHKASRGGNDFVSLASHELRSPLSVIKWYTEILLDGDAGDLTKEQKDYLTIIESNNQRAIDLVRSLLNVSRLDQSTYSVTPEDVSLAEIVETTKNFFSKEASKKHVEVIYKEGEGVTHIQADKHICLLIAKQLISNAIVFSPDNGVVEVTTSYVKQSETIGNVEITDDSIVLTVIDKGMGVPEKDKSKIFSRMFRGSNVKDTEGSDGGLGLYITKTIVDSTGGKIWFESEEGKGTTFFVAFLKSGMKKKDGTTVLE